VNELNDHTKTKFDEVPTYQELLFGTLTGITGVILLVIILIMAMTSLECVRKKWFQLFGYTHMALFPIF
jgi:DMSO/TMAO reductase YedYZ heme-binding membrane subunit